MRLFKTTLRAALLAAATALAACQTLQGAPADEAPPRGGIVAPPFAGPPMSPMALAEHIQILSSDAFAGREPASPGEKLTLDYLSQVFARAGLEPGWNGGWLQPVPLTEAMVVGAPTLKITGADGSRDYAYGGQHVVFSKRTALRQTLVDAPLVFVGYGVVAPELGWNDYADVDVRGKIAVILINDPDIETPADHPTTGKFGGKAMTYYGRWTYKFEEAGRQGAAGALIIHETGPAAYPWAVVQSSWTGPQFDTMRVDAGASRAQIEGWIENAAAVEIMTRSGQDFAKLKAAAQLPGFKAVPLTVTGSIDLTMDVRNSVSHNVVGLLRGRAAPEETVLYGAHWDHLGQCEPIDGDSICNGALDNATGVAGLIELARRFAGDGRPRRSALFVAFTAEEQGLLGSAYYAQNPAFPANRTVMAVNMDGASVYGPTRDVTVVGYGKSEIEATLKRFAADQGRVVRAEEFPERGSFYRSDHFNLAKVGIPVIYAAGGFDLATGGVTRGRELSNEYIAKRYHKPQDHYDPSWDLAGQSQDLQLLYNVGRSYADSEEWPQWLEGTEFRAIREQSLTAR